MGGALKWILGGVAAFYLWNKITTATTLLKTNVAVVGFRFHKIALDYTTIKIDIRLENFSDNRIVLNFIRFHMYLNGSYAGYVNQNLGQHSLESYGSVVVTCTINLQTSLLLKILTQYLASSEGRYTIDVAIDGAAGLSGTSYGFTPRFKVNIPTLKSLVDGIKDMFDRDDDTEDLAPSSGITVIEEVTE